MIDPIRNVESFSHQADMGFDLMAFIKDPIGQTGQHLVYGVNQGMSQLANQIFNPQTQPIVSPNVAPVTPMVQPTFLTDSGQSQKMDKTLFYVAGGLALVALLILFWPKKQTSVQTSI